MNTSKKVLAWFFLYNVGSFIWFIATEGNRVGDLQSAYASLAAVSLVFFLSVASVKVIRGNDENE